MVARLSCILMHTSVSSNWVVRPVFFERYTRVLLQASSEFPIHFLKIYRREEEMMVRRHWILVVLCSLRWCLAAWGHPLDTLQPGTWMEIPSSKMQAVLYPYPPACPMALASPLGR